MKDVALNGRRCAANHTMCEMDTVINTDIESAVRLLKSGEIVAVPTETVYGLAGNALAPEAIAKIFAAKNRPQDNPLIVHVDSVDSIKKIGLRLPPLGEALARRFCPGPLTMVLPKVENIIPAEISCGLGSVAVRIPACEIFADIIKRCGFPIAAPSANRSGRPSPTAAQHVYDDLKGKIPLIIDGGKCKIGVESTVIAFDNDKIRILRPGTITPEMLSEFAETIVDKSDDAAKTKTAIVSPGTAYKHYSPKAKVVTLSSDAPAPQNKFVIETPDTQTLYAKFREADEKGVDIIYVRLPEPAGVGLALYDRIIRAADNSVACNTVVSDDSSLQGKESTQ